MALVLADRVRETTAVVGTGTATLLGAIASYQSFAAIGDANTVYYTIVDQSTGEWEVGIGTYTASGTTLARTTVLSSSNGGALVNFAAGTKDVWGDYPAGKAVTTDTLAYPPAIGGTTPNDGTFTEVAVTTATGNSAFNENDTITGWLYSGNSFSVSAQEGTPNGLFIGSAGTKMYVNGAAGDDVNEYTLGTAWDITTATFVTAFSTTAQDTVPADVFFKPNGLSMYVLGDTNNTVFQYTLGTAWSVATASYASKSFSVAAQETSPTGLWFKPDGTVMYVVGTSIDTVFQYALATAWDVSTASYGGVFYSFAAQETSPQQVNLSDDGLKMWMLGATGDDIWEYNLGTAWNVSTATPVNNFYIGFQDTAPTGLFIDSTAPNRVYMLGNSFDTIFQYNTENNAVKLDTQKLYVDGGLTVNDNFVAGANAYIDGTLTAQGSVNFGSLTTFSITAGGTMSLGTGTGTVTNTFGAGATVSGSTKTLNIGTAGLSGSTTAINIGSAVSGSLGTTTIQAPTVNIGQLATQFSVTNTASAVNYVQVTGNATGAGPIVSAQGSDTNVDLLFSTKGTAGSHVFRTNTTVRQFQINHVTSAVNYGVVTGSIAGNAVPFTVAGSDTNISQVFQSKGTGAIDLAAGSSGVNISNGGTVTAITRTAAGSGYTTIPSVAISAPTTAGGVNATVAIASMTANTGATVSSGGTGYTIGDVLSVVGGTTATVPLTITVTAVSGGVITTASTNNAAYSVLPTNPVSVTGGTGTGATFNLTWIVSTFTITNAGSGYVEQPTVTFSGGGGSGAAAYATVGAGTIIRSLGSTGSQSLDFYTPAGIITGIPNLRLRDTTSDSYWTSSGQTQTALLTASGNTNAIAMILANGTGNVTLRTGGGSQFEQLRVAHTASAVNYVQVTGGATTKAVVQSAQGSDANVSHVTLSKGTGAIDLAAGSSGVNISNGGTVTAITRTAGGGSYTSTPTVVISAPTTAGGVQATATVTVSTTGTPTIVSGGTGYTVGDVLSIVGGTPVSVAATMTVTSVSGGVVTAASYTNFAQYTTPPTGTISVTGGTGSGATFNISFAVTTAFTITNAGSGYVEQPTVSFSGGGGSGATAYATVGSIPTVKSIGSAISFATPSGEQFRIRDNTTTAVNYGTIKGSGSGSTVDFGVDGADGGITLALKSKGTGGIFMYTAGGNNAQLGVPHTANAVNYVQVTGAATGGQVAVSSQGSDTSVPLSYVVKGFAAHRFCTNSTTSDIQFLIYNTTTARNYLQVTGATVGNSPKLESNGSDTNIDLALTPKGTGNVRFGTYTASMALTIQGYVEIKDAGGTIRKLAVIA